MPLDPPPDQFSRELSENGDAKVAWGAQKEKNVVDPGPPQHPKGARPARESGRAQRGESSDEQEDESAPKKSRMRAAFRERKKQKRNLQEFANSEKLHEEVTVTFDCGVTLTRFLEVILSADCG